MPLPRAPRARQAHARVPAGSERSPACCLPLNERLALVEEVERFTRTTELETDVRERLDRVRDRVAVLGHPQRLERLSRIALGGRRLCLLGEQPRLRPVETGASVGIDDIVAACKCPGDDSLGAGEITVVGERVAEHRREPDVLEDVVGGLVSLDAPLEQRDRRAELADRAVGTGEALGDARPFDDVGSPDLDRLFEQFDRIAVASLAECKLPETRQRLGPRQAVRLTAQRLLVETPCSRQVIETERDFRIEPRRLGRIARDRSGRQVVGADTRAACRAAGAAGATESGHRPRSGRYRRESSRDLRARAD